MSHLIEKNDHMVSAAGLLPWHKLGTVRLEKALTAKQALEAAKLAWMVEGHDIYDADMKQIKGFKVLRRSDDKTDLSVVKNTYTPVQNNELLEIAESLAQTEEALDFKPVIETAGSLRGGKVVWALVQIAEAPCAGSLHKKYLLLSNGHGEGKALKGTLTDVRVVCNNTLSLAEAASSMFCVSHTKNIMERTRDAVKLLGWATKASNSTFALFEQLARVNVTKDEAADFFRKVTPPTGISDKKLEEQVEKLLELYKDGPGVEGRSLFDCVNAVTDFVDHHKDFRGESSESQFLWSAFGGVGDRMKKLAFSNARELATA